MFATVNNIQLHELETAVALRERRRIMAHAIDDTLSKTPNAAS